MKLQKQLSRKVDNKIYPKWVVVIPPEKINEANWKEGDELEVKVTKGSLLIKKKN